jgi:hypothetical protein
LIQLLGDLKALGKWAPVRAIYEALHRTGALGTTLRWQSRRPVPEMSSPFVDWPPNDFRTGWQAAADKIVAGEIPIFGEIVLLADPPNWHDDGAGGSWSRIPTWRIDLYDDARRDVKHAWEVGRHRHLVVMARAAADSGSMTYIATIETHLRSWFEQNPPEVGLHWFSSLEIALRALAWLEILALVGEQLSPSVRQDIASHLYHSGRHIIAELPYTLSSMRNNHFIGDAVGLVAIGKAFAGDRRAARWVRLGDKMLVHHIPDHVADDGSTLEDSLGYRGFVMELLAARIALGGAPGLVRDALAAAAKHSSRSGVESGVVPRFGDWDGGSALAGPIDTPLPLASLVVAHRLLRSADGAAATEDGSDAGGGLARVSRGRWTVFLKAGTGRSHEHSDLLSVAIARDDMWITGDPANGSYNRDADERNYYRTSPAHNVLRVEGIDQREPHRRFRWRYHPNGTLGEPIDAGPYRVMWGHHDAYQRLEPGRVVVRACLVGVDSVVVADWIQGGSAAWDLSLPLAPDVAYIEDEETRRRTLGSLCSGNKRRTEAVLYIGDAKVGLRLPGLASVVRGSTNPYAGWWADDYDRVRPATKLDVKGKGQGPFFWVLWEGRRPDITTEGTALIVDGYRVDALAGPGQSATVTAGRV